MRGGSTRDRRHHSVMTRTNDHVIYLQRTNAPQDGDRLLRFLGSAITACTHDP